MYLKDLPDSWSRTKEAAQVARGSTKTDVVLGGITKHPEFASYDEFLTISSTDFTCGENDNSKTINIGKYTTITSDNSLSCLHLLALWIIIPKGGFINLNHELCRNLNHLIRCYSVPKQFLSLSLNFHLVRCRLPV